MYVVLYDPEPAYRRRFLMYARSRDELRGTVAGAEDPADALQLCRNGRDAVFLTSGSVWQAFTREEREELRGAAALCGVLTEDPESAGAGEAPGSAPEDGGDGDAALPGNGRKERRAEVLFLDRYQPVPDILEELYGALAAGGLTERETDGGAVCTAVYAPCGAAGRTAAALTYAAGLSEQENTLFISFCPVASFHLPESSDGEERGLSELLYIMKNEGRIRWSPGLTRSLGKLRVLPPVSSPEDLWELEPEETAAVLEGVRQMSGCRRLVAELPEGLPPLPVLEICGEILLAGDDTEDGRRGREEFLSYLRRKEREDLLERCRSLTPGPLPELRGMSAGDPLFRYSRSAEELRRTLFGGGRI